MSMFRKLRLKLTFINIVVVVIITGLFMTGIYGLMIRGMHQSSSQLMRIVASEAGSNPAAAVSDSRWKWRGPNYFYVKVNNLGEIIESSANNPLAKEELQKLVKQSLIHAEASGNTELLNEQQNDPANGQYRFLKAPLNDGTGTAIVFRNTETEDRFIGHLLGAFAVAGLGAAGLALAGSLFMASRALIPIKKSWESQKAFVGDASHELRTPLAVIQTNLDIVLGNPNDSVQSQEKWLRNIQAESEYMIKLIDDLLFLARTDAHQGHLQMEFFSLSLLLKDVLCSFENVAAQQNKELCWTIEDEINFFGDRTRLKQLSAILLDNAIKYTPSGGIVSLEVKDAPHHLEIVISDTGEGIAKEHLAKVFNRFYRVDKSRSRQSGGTGLGLSIAEWVVREHKGSIKVNSIPGKGTTFSVSLPKNQKSLVKDVNMT